MVSTFAVTFDFFISPKICHEETSSFAEAMIVTCTCKASDVSREPLIIVTDELKPNYRVALAMVIKNNSTQMLVVIHLFHKYIFTQKHTNKKHIYSFKI